MLLPTNKPHVSYSEVSNWKACPWRHKLSYVDGLSVFEASVYTIFGTALHSGAEKYLQERVIDKDAVISQIEEGWQKHRFDDPEVVEKQIEDAANAGWNFKHFPVEEWKKWAHTILDDLPAFMDENFNEWEYVSAEEYLYEDIPEGGGVKYKGFIDGIIKDKTKRGKERYWVIDWKTAGPGGWRRDKKQDFLVQAQIASYKSYWARREGIDPKNIQCAFVLLKRQGKPGKSISMVRVSVGPKMLDKTEKLIRSAVKGIKSGFAPKNRNSCKFCEFKGTEHCP